MSTALVPNPKPPSRKGCTYQQMFDDIRCDEGMVAPKQLQVHLAALGGWTIYDRPFFRIARAETVWRKISIDFPIWMPGDDPNWVIPIPDAVTMMREGLEKNSDPETLIREVREFVHEHAENFRARRAETGYRWVKKYHFDGIVLEKWNPPDNYGDPVEWEAQKILGFSFCGPYPHEGDYELVGGEEEHDEFYEGLVDGKGNFFKKDRRLLNWPSKDRVMEILQNYHNDLMSRHEDPLTRTHLRLAEFEQREIARFKRVESYTEPYVRDLQQILKSVSLEAGRLREKLVRQCKHNWGHVGA